VFGDPLLGQVAQAALATGGATVGAEREGSAQAAAERGAEIAVGGVRLEELLRLGAEPGNKILHLPAMLALPGGVDQTVEAIDERAIAPVGVGVTGLIAAFPA